MKGGGISTVTRVRIARITVTQAVRTGRDSTALAHGRLRDELAEHADRALVVCRPVGRDGQPAGCPAEQLGAEMRLQLLDELRHGWLRRAEGGGRLGEAAGLDDAGECAERGDLVDDARLYCSRW